MRLKVAVTLALTLMAGTVSPERGVIKIRVEGGMAYCLSRALAGVPGADFVVEVGDPAAVGDADLIVGTEAGLVRTLEGGVADGRAVVDLGLGEWIDHRPSMVIAAAVSDSPYRAQARQVLDRLRAPSVREAFAACAGVGSHSLRAPAAESFQSGLAKYAVRIVDWWLPECSKSTNIFNDPSEVLGAPNAVALGGKDNYRGFMSLGQGGWVVVDMGQTIQNGPGNDIRIYQSQADEPVTLYAGDEPNGKFTQVTFRRPCGNRAPGLFSGYCDFDLAEAGIVSARYLRIEDGELYPCLRRGTQSEGADIDAVELLNQ
jgi:hypothetical protein